MGFKKILTIAVGIVAITGIFTGVVVSLNHHRTNNSNAVTASPYTKGQPHNSGTKNNKSTNNSSPKTPNTSAQNNQNISSSQQSYLIAPYGSFVSDHSPNLSGSPHPNLINSVCSTNPGVACQISFSNGSTTKYLPSQTTDAGGSTYWTWHLQDIGLTVGSWKIIAKATLGSQTKTTTDPMPLQVSP